MRIGGGGGDQGGVDPNPLSPFPGPGKGGRRERIAHRRRRVLSLAGSRFTIGFGPMQDNADVVQLSLIVQLTQHNGRACEVGGGVRSSVRGIKRHTKGRIILAVYCLIEVRRQHRNALSATYSRREASFQSGTRAT